MGKKEYIKKALDWVNLKSTSSVKAKLDGYEDPKVFTNTTSDDVVQADISFTTHSGSKNYTDIALKQENPRKLVTRWKLLSVMASLKRGKLYLMAPKGHKMFTQRLVDRYNINAIVQSI